MRFVGIFVNSRPECFCLNTAPEVLLVSFVFKKFEGTDFRNWVGGLFLRMRSRSFGLRTNWNLFITG
jgi:hypothetical protein